MANVTYILTLRDRVSRAAKQAQNSLNRITASAEKVSESIDGIGLLAGGAAVAGLFHMGAELEKTTLFFNTLTGSVEKGTKLFEGLTEFANTTPFSNEALNKNAQTLLAFGQDADGVIKTLRMLGDVAGGDQDRLQRLSLAFAQSGAAGRLMGQDLLQFINAGFNPLNEISKQTGMSMLELKKQMEKGLISFDMVKKAFEAATGAGGKFHNLTGQMADTMAGKWSTALGKGRFLIAELGLSMKELFTPFLDGIIKAIDFMSKYRAAVFPILKALTIFTAVVVGLAGALKAWVAIQRVLNFLLTANPIGIIIVAVAALIAIIVTVYQESETFRLILGKLWNALKAIWAVISTALKPAIMALWGSVSKLWNIFKSLFELLDFGKGEIKGFSRVVEFVLTRVLMNLLLPIEAVINLLSDFFNIVSKIGAVLKAVFIGDMAAAKVGLQDLGNALKDFFQKRIQLFLQGFGLLSDAIKQLFAGDFAKAADSAFMGAKQITFAPFGVDVNQTAKTAKDAAKAAIKAFNEGTAASKIDAPGLAGSAATSAGAIGLSDDVKKLQAEGVVSGGIKTFNINIGTLTGINTLSTENIEDSATQTGNAVRDELLKVLADTKQLG